MDTNTNTPCPEYRAGINAFTVDRMVNDESDAVALVNRWEEKGILSTAYAAGYRMAYSMANPMADDPRFLVSI